MPPQHQTPFIRSHWLHAVEEVRIKSNPTRFRTSEFCGVQPRRCQSGDSCGNKIDLAPHCERR